MFAYEHAAYQRWLARQHVLAGPMTARAGGGLAGAELEHVLMAMAATNPDIVAVRIGPKVH